MIDPELNTETLTKLSLLPRHVLDFLGDATPEHIEAIKWAATNREQWDQRITNTYHDVRQIKATVGDIKELPDNVPDLVTLVLSEHAQVAALAEAVHAIVPLLQAPTPKRRFFGLLAPARTKPIDLEPVRRALLASGFEPTPRPGQRMPALDVGERNGNIGGAMTDEMNARGGA